MIYGHQPVVQALEQDLPQVTLLLGPSSVGKRTIAEHLVVRHGLRNVFRVSPLRMSSTDTDAGVNLGARELVAAMNRRSMSGGKAALIDLDDATTPATNALLKLLEEPPEQSVFILWTSTSPLLTIASRSTTFRLGYLSVDDVTEILKIHSGMGETDARAAAAASGGQVSVGVDAVQVVQSQTAVLQLLKALSDQDPRLVDAVMSKIDTPKALSILAALRVWAKEAATGTWSLYSSEDSYGLDRDRRTVERVLRWASSPLNPRLALRMAVTK